MSITRASNPRRISASSISFAGGTYGRNQDAAAWRNAVIAAGSNVSETTFAAVEKLCQSIDLAGLRDKFLRLNLLCGDDLAAALIPIYRGQSFSGTQVGSASDFNANFVNEDYSETGSSSGLQGDGATKFLDTGLNAGLLTASNSHMGFGLRATDTGDVSFRAIGGAYDGSSRSFEMSIRRDESAVNCFFTRFGVGSDRAGESVQESPLAEGDLLMAWPSFYRNGAQTGAEATTSQDYGSSHSIFVFALNFANAYAINHTDARMNWYSVGLTMTSAQAADFYDIIDEFNTTLGRT